MSVQWRCRLLVKPQFKNNSFKHIVMKIAVTSARILWQKKSKKCITHFSSWLLHFPTVHVHVSSLRNILFPLWGFTHSEILSRIYLTFGDYAPPYLMRLILPWYYARQRHIKKMRSLSFMDKKIFKSINKPNLATYIQDYITYKIYISQ